MMNYIERFLNLHPDSHYKGTVNELLIAGNISKFNYKVNVLKNNNPNYDIMINRDNITNYVECKFDNKSHITGNLFFEYWNYTFNRYTGIYNDDMNTIYTHTYQLNGEYYALIGKRKLFNQVINLINNKHKEHIKEYDKAFVIDGKLKGDRAFIVNRDLFIKYFKGYNVKLKPCFAWYVS